MAGTSALLKSAASRRAAIQNEKNRLIDMEWQLSAQTEADFKAYTSHYDKLLQTSGSTEQITYTNKIISARRSFTTNEIQRLSIGVLEGTNTNEDKLNSMISLYNTAYENGDYSQAQDLNLQIDNLYKTVAKEQERAMNVANQMYQNGYTESKQYFQDLKEGSAPIFSIPGVGGVSVNDINTIYESNGPEGVKLLLEASAQQLEAINPDPTKPINTQAMSDLYYMAGFLTVENAKAELLDYAPTSTEYRNLSNQIWKMENEGVVKIPKGNGEFTTLSLNKMAEARENSMGGTGFLVPNGNLGFDIAKVVSYKSVLQANGEYKLVGMYGNTITPTSQAVPIGEEGMYGLTNIAKGGQDFMYVEATVGNREKQQYRLINGELVDGDGKSVAKAKDVPDMMAVRQTPEELLKSLGLAPQNGSVFIPDGAKDIPKQYQGQNLSYTVDQNGNLQLNKILVGVDPDTGQQTRTRTALIFNQATKKFEDFGEIALAQEHMNRTAPTPVTDAERASIDKIVKQREQQKKDQLAISQQIAVAPKSERGGGGSYGNGELAKKDTGINYQDMMASTQLIVPANSKTSAPKQTQPAGPYKPTTPVKPAPKPAQTLAFGDMSRFAPIIGTTPAKKQDYGISNYSDLSF